MISWGVSDNRALRWPLRPACSFFQSIYPRPCVLFEPRTTAKSFLPVSARVNDAAIGLTLNTGLCDFRISFSRADRLHVEDAMGLSALPLPKLQRADIARKRLWCCQGTRKER